ncbi:MAG: dihydrolipoamide succinyltransferase [Betaproteobacteria bacterium RIFCSPLOWO2_02_FULL_65_24]|nr:MAG: dihydrolipoamide succinyltransferase [Betaproteobacteria bacterium RIFCSPLOWO2_02_FULL_65_24]OGA94644.1 MAG: dihydrolipoamide succinyltransferase [Betaproteobacteria bacterium RIFCSPLOWO2_12_FULL_66_14]
MLIEVKVPQLSESVSEATLLAWHKKEGEAVQRDENLVDVETDKVVLELPAPADGVLRAIAKGNGASVVASEVIATIDTEARAGAAAPAPANGVKPEPAAVPLTPPPAPEQARQDARLMPAARKLVAEQGIDTTRITGSGRDGRITKADVTEAASRAAPPPAPAQPATARPSLPPAPKPVDVEQMLAGRPEQRVPMSRLRQRIAERLVQSQSTAAILTTFNEVNMQPVMELRRKYQERFEKEHGVRLGFMSFFVKASVYALKKFPVLNASVDGTDIIYHGYFDIGVAVASPRGLVVPVLRDADQMSFAEIEKQIADLGKRAQEGRLAIEELAGGTFSISNGGVFGSMLSTPIINPPQSAILGVHLTKDRAVVESGQIVIRPMNYLALSYDHRIIDGREAVLSLVAIKEALEDPARLLLDL